MKYTFSFCIIIILAASQLSFGQDALGIFSSFYQTNGFNDKSDNYFDAPLGITYQAEWNQSLGLKYAHALQKQQVLEFAVLYSKYSYAASGPRWGAQHDGSGGFLEESEIVDFNSVALRVLYGKQWGTKSIKIKPEVGIEIHSILDFNPLLYNNQGRDYALEDPMRIFLNLYGGIELTKMIGSSFGISLEPFFTIKPIATDFGYSYFHENMFQLGGELSLSYYFNKISREE